MKAGSLIYQAGRGPAGVFLVRKGSVEVARLGPRQRKVGLAVIGPGEVLGYVGLLPAA